MANYDAFLLFLSIKINMSKEKMRNYDIFIRFT